MKSSFPFIAAALRKRRTVQQPVPDVSEDDVKRIVRREFPKERFETIMELLAGYGKETSERGGPRVRLAVLKLAEGRFDAVHRHLETAKRDYRDVLVAAEYPESWKATSQVRTLSKNEHQRVIEADWKQYQSWLRR